MLRVASNEGDSFHRFAKQDGRGAIPFRLGFCMPQFDRGEHE
jgi:hypothetical protein